MAKSLLKSIKFDAGVLTLVLVVIGLPAIYFASTSKVGQLTTTNQHAAGPADTSGYQIIDQSVSDAIPTPYTVGCRAWRNHEHDVYAQNAHIYVHLYELYDPTTGASCGQFYGRSDIDIAPNEPGSNFSAFLKDNSGTISSLSAYTTPNGNWWSFQKGFIHISPTRTIGDNCNRNIFYEVIFAQRGFQTQWVSASCGN